MELSSKSISLINSIQSVGLGFQFSIAGMAEIKLSEKLKTIAEDTFAQSLILDRDSECDRKAHDRVERDQAPAKRGKSESKDCLIVEHYIKLVKTLRESSFERKIVFVTSNKTDFGSPSAPNPPLDTQFSSHSITYCNNFGWALQVVEGQPD